MTVAEAATAPVEPATPGKPPRRISRDQVFLLIGLPIVVIVVFAGWLIWRATANLDDIEQRQLAWGTIGDLLVEHLTITLVGTVVVLVVAIPLGIALTRPGIRWAAPVVMALANIGQSAPVIGLIVLLAMILGFGFWIAILALAFYAFLPVLANTIIGLQGVDPTLVEASRGMGMSNSATLFRVELPLAVPVIMVGVRTALVLLVGTASFATFIDAGGLGELIDTGIKLFRYSVLASGGLLIALLALLIDWAGRVLETLTRPKGL